MEANGGVGGQQHATTGVRFKLDQPTPFEGKMVDGSLLESWLYQMDFYSAIESSISPELCVAPAALLLMGNVVSRPRLEPNGDHLGLVKGSYEAHIQASRPLASSSRKIEGVHIDQQCNKLHCSLPFQITAVYGCF